MISMNYKNKSLNQQQNVQDSYQHGPNDHSNNCYPKPQIYQDTNSLNDNCKNFHIISSNLTKVDQKFNSSSPITSLYCPMVLTPPSSSSFSNLTVREKKEKYQGTKYDVPTPEFPLTPNSSLSESHEYKKNTNDTTFYTPETTPVKVTSGYQQMMTPMYFPSDHFENRVTGKNLRPIYYTNTNNASIYPPVFHYQQSHQQNCLTAHQVSIYFKIYKASIK